MILKVLVIILLFQDLLANNVAIFMYLDEFLALSLPCIAFLLLMNKNKKITFYKEEVTALYFFGLFLLFGILGNIMHEYNPILLALKSALLTVKGYIIYFSSRVIFQCIRVEKNFFNFISKFLTLAMFIIILSIILNIKFDFMKIYDYRFGIGSVAAGFSHATELGFFTVTSMIIILFNDRIYKNNNVINLIILVALFIVIFTGRTKSIVFMIIFIILSLFMRITKKIRLMYFVPLFPIAISIAMPRIRSEFVDGVRGILYYTSMLIASDHFPFGAGFGTFGSNISRVHYSILYHNYLISGIWGLSPESPEFIVDTYWAMILGENGWLGLIFIIVCLLCIFFTIYRTKLNYRAKFIAISICMYSILASLAEPIYSSNKCAALFIILSIFVSTRNDNPEEKSKYEG